MAALTRSGAKRATLRHCIFRARQSFDSVATPVTISLSQRRPRAGCCPVKTSAESLPTAVKCSDDDFEACIAHLRPPVTHRRWCALAELDEAMATTSRESVNALVMLSTPIMAEATKRLRILRCSVACRRSPYFRNLLAMAG